MTMSATTFSKCSIRYINLPMPEFSEVYEADMEQEDYGDKGGDANNNDNWYTVT